MAETLKLYTEEQEKELRKIIKTQEEQRTSKSQNLENALEKIVDSLQRIEGLMVVALQNR